MKRKLIFVDKLYKKDNRKLDRDWLFFTFVDKDTRKQHLICGFDTKLSIDNWYNKITNNLEGEVE